MTKILLHLLFTFTPTYVTVNNKSIEVEARDCRNIGFYGKRGNNENVQRKRQKRSRENLNFSFSINFYSTTKTNIIM